jgi:hypothetical protein
MGISLHPHLEFGGALVVVAAMLATLGCGETYDLADRPAVSGSVATDTLSTATSVTDPLDIPIPADADLSTLFAALLDTWRGLDQRVIDGDRATDAMARLESIWAQTEPVIRRERPSALFGFGQAMDLARSAVERRRPADASKGLVILTNLVKGWPN